jgi:hypothetical protein
MFLSYGLLREVRLRGNEALGTLPRLSLPHDCSCTSSCFPSFSRSISLVIGCHGRVPARCVDSAHARPGVDSYHSYVLLQLCFTVGIPAVVTIFLLFWHAVRASARSCASLRHSGYSTFSRPLRLAQGLGQPGLLRATILGQVVFYGASALCFYEISASLACFWSPALCDTRPLFLQQAGCFTAWIRSRGSASTGAQKRPRRHRSRADGGVACRILFIFGFSVVFPTFIYRSIVAPLSVRVRRLIVLHEPPCSAACIVPWHSHRLRQAACVLAPAVRTWRKRLQQADHAVRCARAIIGLPPSLRLAGCSLIVHPAICETALCILRNFARQVRTTRAPRTNAQYASG